MRLQPKRLRPGEILGLCQGPVVRVKKSMGQNFCIDQNLFREVIERLSPHPSEEIWEIGPGLGSLTEHLIRTGVPVQTFELDERLKKPLAEKFPEGVRFQWGDFLQFPLETMTPGAGNYVVCGNLPYYCGTPIIRKVLWLNPPPRKMVFVLQEEVVRKAVSLPDSRDYGFLSAQLQLFAEVKIGTIFPPSSFSPRPKVSSAILEIVPKVLSAAEVRCRNMALHLLSIMLRERRKMSLNLLNRAIKLPWDEHFARCGLPRGIRGEAIPFQTLIDLASGLPEEAYPKDFRDKPGGNT